MLTMSLKCKKKKKEKEKTVLLDLELYVCTANSAIKVAHMTHALFSLSSEVIQ